MQFNIKEELTPKQAEYKRAVEDAGDPFTYIVEGRTCVLSRAEPFTRHTTRDGDVELAVVMFFFQPSILVPGMAAEFGPYAGRWESSSGFHLPQAVEPRTALARKALLDRLARQAGFRYQETGLARVDGDADYADKTEYSRG